MRAVPLLPRQQRRWSSGVWTTSSGKPRPTRRPACNKPRPTKKGAMHCSFNKFPKGTEVPTHTHTNDIASVVLAGTFGSTDEAGNGKPQPAGSFQSVPGGHKHSTKCTADADCIIFSCQPGPFDIKMPTAAGGKK